MSEIATVLKDLGFEDREIKIYLSLLQLGDMTALKISRDTGIDRTTTYDVLQKLIMKGVVSSYTKNDSKNFRTLSPEKLLNHFKEKYSSLEKIIPQLDKISSVKSEPVKCDLYCGTEGLKTIIKDVINSAKDYRVIGIREEYEEIIGYFTEQAVMKLDKFRAKEIAIVEKNAKFTKLKNGVYRYLNKKILSPITTVIYENKVVFFIWKEPYFAISIENEHLAAAQIEYFKILWQAADQY